MPGNNYHSYSDLYSAATLTTATSVGTNIIGFTLSLLDSSKNLDLLNKLQKKSKWLNDDLEYSFVVEAVINKIVQADQSIIEVPGIKISFDYLNINNMLSYIFSQLYEIGYGLELYMENYLRVTLNVGTEKHYLERANALLKNLQQNGDEPTSIELQRIFKLCFEIADNYRYSLVYKIARKMQYYKLFKCASALVAIYKGNELFKNLALELESRFTDFDDDYFSEIQRLPVKSFESKILAIVSHKEIKSNLYDLNGKALLEFIARLHGDREKIINCLKADDLKVSTAMAVSTFEPQCDVVWCAIEPSQIYEKLDKVFMKLCFANLMLDIRAQYGVRSGLGVQSIDDYTKAATRVIEYLKDDEPTSFEFNWLIRMSYELPRNDQVEFVLQVANILRQKHLFKCALSLAVIYYNDPLCKDIKKLVDELRFIIAFRDAAQYLKPKTNESEEEKVFRLENAIRLIVKQGFYDRLKESINKILCELAGVDNNSHDVIKFFDPANLDASFRKIDFIRNANKEKSSLMLFSSLTINQNTRVDTMVAEFASETAELTKDHILSQPGTADHKSSISNDKKNFIA